MSKIQLTAEQKKQLKAAAHALNPVVIISENGLSANVIKEIDNNLKAHELIKIRVIADAAMFEDKMHEFYLTSNFSESREEIDRVLKYYSDVPVWKQWLSLVILVFTLLAMIFEDKIRIKLCISGGIGALLLILTGVISEKDALKSIDLKTIFLFGGTLSLVSALQSTGAGELIAGKVIGALGENPSPYILTLVVFLLCCIMTNFMSNTATTALMVPICLSIAQGMGADPRAVLIACVIGGSCAYATPIGMPANTMVVGAGGYKFMDYVKSGFPLIIIATVVSMIILPIAFPFFP